MLRRRLNEAVAARGLRVRTSFLLRKGRSLLLRSSSASELRRGPKDGDVAALAGGSLDMLADTAVLLQKKVNGDN